MLNRQNYAAIENEEVQDRQDPVDTDLLQATTPGYGTRHILEAAMNIVNATVGAGVIGLPYALSLAGFSYGIVLSILVGLLTFNALCLMVMAGKRVGIYNFADMADYSMGRFGYHTLNLTLFIQSAGSCVSYFILVADTIPILFGLYFPEYRLLADRQLVTILVSVFVIFPLNLSRSIGALARWSIVSVLLLPVMLISVLIRAPAYAPDHHAPLFSSGKDFLGALGIMCFAFVCTQVAFSNFLSQRNQSMTGWSWTAAISTVVSWLTSMGFAAIGYLSFGTDVDSNIFNNFPVDDNVINIGRLALGLSMVLTVPMAFYPARDAVQKTLGFEKGHRQPSTLEHHVVTVILFAAFLMLGIYIRSLGRVYSVVGGLASSFVAYIAPGASYLAVFRPTWLRKSVSNGEDEALLGKSPESTWWRDACSVFLILFGILIMICTLISAFR
ncbi:hypothetical protein EC973_000537 [Apophysomyces ossiformis]|uniref:Amino acid transporter transmembrane domain-containing protein n=1 Tax=Apophysomyces ossiformis TaxID=679940 RepID=A0A8H7BQJ5_9FUNG|nr:hypothetical protein EC973_000537 [Apophysomyces ossiformis]